jgi:hypothetical protein
MSGTFRVSAESCWLVLNYPKNPTIRLDARVLDRIVASDDEIVLEANDFGIALQVRSGVAAAASIATVLAPYTRSAPMTSPETYEDAKRRLQQAMNPTAEPWPTALVVGDDVVTISRSTLWIGSISYPHQEIAERMASAGLMEVPGGWLNASVAMLVIADLYRRPEDPEALRAMIQEYEARLAEQSASQGS